MRHVLLALALTLIAVGAPAARAEESATPFIDQLKREIGPAKGATETASDPDPFIQSQKAKLAPEKEGSFIDRVKNENPAYFQKNGDGSYTDKAKAELGPDKEGSAIKAVAEGHSELHARKKTSATNAAFGLQYTDILNPDFTATAGQQPFDKVYPHFTPDVALTYDRRLWSFWSGQIAFNASLGGTFNKGQGIFKYPLRNYNTDPPTDFSQTSSTNFQFFSIPISASLNYRMTGLKYIQPYVSFGPELIPYLETRDDNQANHYGDSRCLLTTVGLWLQLDWINKHAAWDLYSDYGVQHFYLTVLYQNVAFVSGGVDFSFSGATIGLTFEY